MKISEISGFIPLLKERGRSSNQEIQLLKRRLDLRKVGHCGTLDPIADGVLPVLVNRATRTMRFFLEYPKTYLATIKLGISTDSLDITGRVISESVPVVDRMEFIDVIKRYRQEIVQKIPEFSASKFKGKSLYHYARKGIKVPEKVRRVVIYEIEMKRFEPPYIEIEVICSSGTYIRQLINDICKELRVDGTMYALTRSSYGRFNLNNSKRLNELTEEDIIPVDKVFLEYGRFFIKSSIFSGACNGAPISVDDCREILDIDAKRFIGFADEKMIGIYRKEGETFFAEVILIE